MVASNADELEKEDCRNDLSSAMVHQLSQGGPALPGSPFFNELRGQEADWS